MLDHRQPLVLQFLSRADEVGGVVGDLPYLGPIGAMQASDLVPEGRLIDGTSFGEEHPRPHYEPVSLHLHEDHRGRVVLEGDVDADCDAPESRPRLRIASASLPRAIGEPALAGAGPLVEPVAAE